MYKVLVYLLHFTALAEAQPAFELASWPSAGHASVSNEAGEAAAPAEDFKDQTEERGSPQKRLHLNEPLATDAPSQTANQHAAESRAAETTLADNKPAETELATNRMADSEVPDNKVAANQLAGNQVAGNAAAEQPIVEMEVSVNECDVTAPEGLQPEANGPISKQEEQPSMQNGTSIQRPNGEVQEVPDQLKSEASLLCSPQQLNLVNGPTIEGEQDLNPAPSDQLQSESTSRLRSQKTGDRSMGADGMTQEQREKLEAESAETKRRREEKYREKQERQKKLEGLCHQGFHSCILAAPSVSPIALLQAVLPLLTPSASFAIFFPALQPLADCMHYLKVS